MSRGDVLPLAQRLCRAWCCLPARIESEEGELLVDVVHLGRGTGVHLLTKQGENSATCKTQKCPFANFIGGVE